MDRQFLSTLSSRRKEAEQNCMLDVNKKIQNDIYSNRLDMNDLQVCVKN